jgi:hypothetical protein
MPFFFIENFKNRNKEASFRGGTKSGIDQATAKPIAVMKNAKPSCSWSATR